jgi:hypothetical protein
MTKRIPDDEFECVGELIESVDEVGGFGGGGGYGMTMRGEGGTDLIFAWNQDLYGYDFVDRIDDGLPRS